MIKPAALYKEVIKCKTKELYYTDDLMYYIGYIGTCGIDVGDEDPSGEYYNWAIVDGGKVVGYIAYHIDWYSSNADRFGFIAFEKKNPAIWSALLEVYKLLKSYNLYRIEFRCIADNPIMPKYVSLVKKLGGHFVILHGIFRDRYGKRHDEIIFEIPCGKSEEVTK